MWSTAELKNDERDRPTLDDAFRRWEAPLTAGLSRLRERGEMPADAEPEQLATMLISALQGGMLLARTRGDVGPLRAVFGVAIDHVRGLRRVLP
jgi:TetR/AcrR family transcriptional repressor of nem operon